MFNAQTLALALLLTLLITVSVNAQHTAASAENPQVTGGKITPPR